MSDATSPGRVVRVSRGKFDPDRLAEVQEMMTATSSYLIPAIQRLPGLISYFAGASPDGSMVNVSVWDSDEHAAQMGALTEMTVDARRDAAAAGVEFINIINYPITWTICPRKPSSCQVIRRATRQQPKVPVGRMII